MTDRTTSYTPKKGDYVVTADLPQNAIRIFYDDMRKAGAVEGSPPERAEERDYFGWDLRDNTVYAYDRLEVADRPLFHNNVTARYRGIYIMTPTTTRNPFQTGDRVVPNGFKARPDGDYYFGSNPTMKRWESDQTVLKVVSTGCSSLIAGDDTVDGRSYSYHYAELRMATAEEIAKADVPKVPKQPTLATGMVIKSNDDGIVRIVTNPEPDENGNIRVTGLGSGSTFFHPARGYTILGQVMPDGDYRPAEAIRAATDPSQWKKGKQVRCITSLMGYITKGRVYTLVTDASIDSQGVARIRIRDNDGDLTTYRVADQFEAV